MALQYLTAPSYEHGLRATLPADEACQMYAPHALLSFIDWRSGSRPLAWRSGLPPSVSLDDDGRRRQSKKTGGPGDTIDGHRRIHHVHAAVDSFERIRYDMNDFVKSTVWANHDRLQTRPSVIEGGQQRGIFVKEDDSTASRHNQQLFPPWLALTAGEHLHIHADGSSHMILSLADATTAIERGWAEREATMTATGDRRNDSSNGSVLPLGYVAVHAPRNATELAEWKRLAMASVRYCTHPCNGMEIRLPERL
ncbi:hypothetical protein CMQ_3663 [Grosmannia clavigera kw1407]|uniref:Luciferase domain-containing protein n=1 Tax=Grosmannia clavigera (strain kw1407 / UAMH 11150) TaxID=655863 RepID=F0XAT9_GROCL|nr:uncharacterized protein CMQ_3663 [Grosmannia clavigera kw1407]EFX05594.1 hypothetical protein CMQ_3663 [Grosmannia clavigera kw1407]